MQQQRRVEPTGRYAGVLGCTGVLPDQLVPRFMRGSRPGVAVGGLPVAAAAIAPSVRDCAGSARWRADKHRRQLHDTLLQSFHGLLPRFQVVSQLLPERPVEAKEQLDGAIARAAKAIVEGRDAVQGLRASTEQTNDLAGTQYNW